MRSVCAILLVLLATAYALRPKDINELESVIIKKFGFYPSYGLYCNPCRQGDTVGALLRLIFHDVVGSGGPNGKGGLNGCIDFNVKDHNGLQEIVKDLDDIWIPYKRIISRADFWLLAANVAIRFASTPADKAGKLPEGLQPSPGTLRLPFTYGRKDDYQCDDSGWIPTVTFDWDQLTDLFVGRFGFTVPELVAIFGAHSCGRAERKNSGIAGGWTTTQASFSNSYYWAIINRRWTKVDKEPVWYNRGTKNIMLKVDVEQRYTPSAKCPVFGFDEKTESKTCEDNEGFGNPHDVIEQYSKDINLFYTYFWKAWTKLVNFEYEHGLATYSY